MKTWLTENSVADDEDEGTPVDQGELDGDVPVEPAHDHADEPISDLGSDYSEGFREAAE